MTRPTVEAEAPDEGLLRLVAPPGAVPFGALFVAIGAAGLLAVGLLHLDSLGLQACTFKAATGIPCFTCGGTRTADLLFHLDVHGAFFMNPLVTSTVFLVGTWGLADLALLPRGRALRLKVSSSAATVLRVGAVAGLLLNWFYLLSTGR